MIADPMAKCLPTKLFKDYVSQMGFGGSFRVIILILWLFCVFINIFGYLMIWCLLYTLSNLSYTRPYPFGSIKLDSKWLIRRSFIKYHEILN